MSRTVVLPNLDPPISERSFWRGLLVALAITAAVVAVIVFEIATHHDRGRACPNQPARVPVRSSR